MYIIINYYKYLPITKVASKKHCSGAIFHQPLLNDQRWLCQKDKKENERVYTMQFGFHLLKSFSFYIFEL